MTAVRSINSSRVKQHQDATKRNSVAANVGYTSVNEGSLRIASEEGLLVQGTARTTGTQHIDGVINVGGESNISGTETVTGALIIEGYEEVNGVLYINGSLRVAGDGVIDGPLSITSTLDVTAATMLKGLVTLSNNLELASGGKITVNGSIPLVIENGTATFANGAQVRGSSGGVTVDGGGGAQMQISLGNAALQSGSNSVSVDGIRTTITGQALVSDDLVADANIFAANLPNAPIAGVPSGTLVQDAGTGRIYAAI